MRALGANALLHAAFEASYGVAPASGSYHRFPFVTSDVGDERPLEEDDLLGTGRESNDPTQGVNTNAGDLTVPVDARAFGHWLKLFFGVPQTTEVTADTAYAHVFTSGAAALPSMAIQVGHPEVPSYAMNTGMRGNTLKIGMQRGGKLNATLGLIGQKETAAASSATGAATEIELTRFAQATGQVKRDGGQLGNVVSAEFTYSNNLDPVETIRPDGCIDGVDPGIAMMTGSIVVKFDSRALLDAAVAGEPVELSFGWRIDDETILVFTLPRVFLPKAKTPITGPKGIQATFNFQASGADGHICSVSLTNDVESYA